MNIYQVDWEPEDAIFPVFDGELYISREKAYHEIKQTLLERKEQNLQFLIKEGILDNSETYEQWVDRTMHYHLRFQVHTVKA